MSSHLGYLTRLDLPISVDSCRGLSDLTVVIFVAKLFLGGATGFGDSSWQRSVLAPNWRVLPQVRRAPRRENVEDGGRNGGVRRSDNGGVSVRPLPLPPPAIAFPTAEDMGVSGPGNLWGGPKDRRTGPEISGPSRS